MPLNKEDVDVYAAQFIADVDFDLVPDILTAHSSIQAGLLLFKTINNFTL